MASHIANAMKNIDEQSSKTQKKPIKVLNINSANYAAATELVTSIILYDLEKRSKSSEYKCLVDFSTGGKKEAWILFSYCKQDANPELFKYLNSAIELTLSAENKVITIPLGTIISGINLPDDPNDMGVQTVMYRLNQLLEKYGRVTIVHEDFNNDTHTDILNKNSEFNVRLITATNSPKNTVESETEKVEPDTKVDSSWANQEDDMRTVPTFPSSSKVTKDTIFHIVFIKSYPKKNMNSLKNRQSFK